jgi:23S rRNA (uracil1939-C5)-methyltransferase
MPIILASKSPRRRELLRKITTDFTVVPGDFDESTIQEKDPVLFAVRAAEMKAREVADMHPGALVIGADTVVACGEEILGKPADREDARRILGRLSGRRHRVITGVALYRKDEDRLMTGYEITGVVFKTLSPEEIEEYLDRNDYMDKAGAYAVQEIGDRYVAELHGDYDNVVGFPVNRVRKLLAAFDAPVVEVEIKDIAFPNAWGVGRVDGRAVFIPGGLPGDRIRAQILKTKRRSAFARTISVEAPSPDRVEAVCPHFGSCGGCAFQNLAYARQIERKHNYILQTLRKIGGVDLRDVEVDPIIPSRDVFGYRNKMEFAFGGDAAGPFLGLRERQSPFASFARITVRLATCPIFSPAVERIFPAVLAFVEKTGLEPYDPRTGQGVFRHLVLREAKATGDFLGVLVTRSGAVPGLDEAATGLIESLPFIKSLWHVENDRVSDVVDYADKRLLAGRPAIEEDLGGFRLAIHPETFIQPNPRTAVLLYEKIAAEAAAVGARKALGLYCGAGAIELFLARTVEEVDGVDSVPGNVRDAERNAAQNGVSGLRFHEGTVEKVLREKMFPDRDLLVIDPPRSGLSPKALRRILELDIPHVLYMSCNPAAFARDAGEFEKNGWRLVRLTPADFFPHTPHVEVLGVLRRN